MLTNQVTGAELISQERHEQIVKHHRTVTHDKQNNNEHQLTDAANVLMGDIPAEFRDTYLQQEPPVGWDSGIWKAMLEKDYKGRLVIAGALIAAEIDRIS